MGLHGTTAERIQQLIRLSYTQAGVGHWARTRFAPDVTPSDITAPDIVGVPGRQEMRYSNTPPPSDTRVLPAQDIAQTAPGATWVPRQPYAGVTTNG
jgi:hypothetical protein